MTNEVNELGWALGARLGITQESGEEEMQVWVLSGHEDGVQKGIEIQGRKTSMPWCLTDLKHGKKLTGIAGGNSGTIPRNEAAGWLLHHPSILLVWDIQERAGSNFGQMYQWSVSPYASWQRGCCEPWDKEDS